jgi:DNA processing protein
MSPATEEQQARWLALVRAPGLGPVLGARLLESFGDPEAALRAGASGWTAAGVPPELQRGLRSPDRAGIEADLAWLALEGRALVPLPDPRYPALLREIPNAPLALFCHGEVSLLGKTQVAIVGARAATPLGRETAEAFAAELTRSGLLVTSGLAVGIDGAAHRGALAAGGATLAVCGTGLDRVYPARHRELAHEIAARGLLVSEFPTGVEAMADHFPRRNRIISGLSRGVLVIEAAAQSGSLITARLALEQGREVFAVPGSIHAPLSRGAHALIRNGAKLTEGVSDILEEIAPQLGLSFTREAPAAPALPPMQQRVLDALGFDATPFDRLVERLAVPVEALSETLLTLELSGRVASAPGGAYQRLTR